MITYDEKLNLIMVFLDGKEVGKIKRVLCGYQYFPKGQKTGGEIFEMLNECKMSLEDD